VLAVFQTATLSPWRYVEVSSRPLALVVIGAQLAHENDGLRSLKRQRSQQIDQRAVRTKCRSPVTSRSSGFDQMNISPLASDVNSEANRASPPTNRHCRRASVHKGGLVVSLCPEALEVLDSADALRPTL
jgi:hypothetical protein